MGGSHTLERFINEVATDIQDPQTNVSVSHRLRARRLARSEDDRLTVTVTASGRWDQDQTGPRFFSTSGSHH